jgi:hypothetical protein
MFASVDLLADHMVASMLAGLSGRHYQQALDPVGDTVAVSSSGTSQSSVSRRFIATTAERLAEFRSRPLDDQRWLICFVDGFDFAGHTMIGALGVTADGTKVPLGVVEGSTENATVVRHLITGLRDRGLDATEGVLFVLDGGKALHKAVCDVFGTHAVIARCRVHKEKCDGPPTRGGAAVGAPQAARRVGEPERRRGRRSAQGAGWPGRLAAALRHAVGAETRPPSLSQPDRMINQEAGTKFHGERVILPRRNRCGRRLSVKQVDSGSPATSGTTSCSAPSPASSQRGWSTRRAGEGRWRRSRAPSSDSSRPARSSIAPMPRSRSYRSRCCRPNPPVPCRWSGSRA